jgi:hypothetical protein
VNGTPSLLDRAQAISRVGLAPRHTQPSWVSVALATVASVAGSLVADAAVVAMGTTLMPSTKGYVHFNFSDDAKLTVIGVLIACVAWPVVTRISSEPRWLFLRLAVLVTEVLLLPDAWLMERPATGAGLGTDGDALGDRHRDLQLPGPNRQGASS